MFETFAVSGQNTLVRESRASADSAQGSLAHWWRSLAGASALTTPLAQIFAEPDSKPVSESTDESAPESADALEAIETTETSVTASVPASETEGECSPAAAAPAEIEPSAQAK